MEGTSKKKAEDIDTHDKYSQAGRQLGTYLLLHSASKANGGTCSRGICTVCYTL